MGRILVTAADFDPGAEMAALSGRHVGGIGCFVGIVRDHAVHAGGDGVVAGGAEPAGGGGEPASPLVALEIEHYPGMTEAAIGAIAAQARARFDLVDLTIIHRFGRLSVGDRIVLVLAASAHRAAALAATSFLIDWLKTRAPFWKREIFADGRAEWVEAREADDAAAARWGEASPS